MFEYPKQFFIFIIWCHAYCIGKLYQSCLAHTSPGQSPRFTFFSIHSSSTVSGIPRLKDLEILDYKTMVQSYLFIVLQCRHQPSLTKNKIHGLRTPGQEITFTAQPKIKFQSRIFRFGRSIFCLPYWLNFFLILWLHWVFIVHAFMDSVHETTKPWNCYSDSVEVNLAL